MQASILSCSHHRRVCVQQWCRRLYVRLTITSLMCVGKKSLPVRLYDTVTIAIGNRRDLSTTTIKGQEGIIQDGDDSYTEV